MQPQTYEQFNAGLASIYDPQTALIQQQQAALPGQYTAQKTALEQARVNAFRDIGNAASSKGMTFSGFSPEQQAQYTGTKYLPALAGLATDQQNKQFSLTQSLNELNYKRGSQAQDLYGSQQNAIAQANAKVQAARISASNKQPSQTQMIGGLTSQIMGALNQTKGRDGYVSPQSYGAARNDWIGQGQSSKLFDDIFSGLRNPYAEDLTDGKKRSLADYGVS